MIFFQLFLTTPIWISYSYYRYLKSGHTKVEQHLTVLLIDNKSHNILADTSLNLSKYDSFGLCDNLTEDKVCLLRYWKSISTLRGVKNMKRIRHSKYQDSFPNNKSHNILADTSLNLSKYDSFGLCDNLTEDQVCLLRYWKSISTLKGVKKHETNTTLEIPRLISKVINFYDPSTIGSGQINSKINNLLEAKQTDHEHYSYIEDMLINFTCHNTSMIIWEYVSLNRISKFGLTYINSMIIKYCVQNQHHQLSSCQNILQSMSDEEKINFSDTSESELFYTSYMSTLGKHQRYLINLLYKLISKAVPTIDEFIHWLGIKNGREHINYQIEMITDIISVYKNSDLTKTIDNITIC
ncbi:hypothetical protein GJ496_010966 [Pomphorhynchus laevis]|nr:hypothetical protein GJ496_010965 [Pomphorhynchus laevis]KAI0982594.1 hypothetical protein GJ496_010966 [Pomphorhynchus laevis]